MSRSIIALPNFAPIPSPMILHSLGHSEASFISSYQTTTLLEHLARIEAQVREARGEIFQLVLKAFQNRQKISLEWFRAKLAEQINSKPQFRGTSEPAQERIYSASYPTLVGWRKNALLLPEESPRMDADRAAAILIMAKVDPRKQGFLPQTINPNEPHKWCYAKTAPDAPVLPCPLPPPLNLPRGTLLYMNWPTFDHGWYWLRPPETPIDAPLGSFQPVGAMRFSSLDFSSLARWDSLRNPEAALIFGTPSTEKELAKEAERIIYRIAPRMMMSISSVPSLPVIFNQQDLARSLKLT